MHERAGQYAQPEDLINLEAVLSAFHQISPDPGNPSQRVVFGTSGHRGRSINGSFNVVHIAAMSLAIAEYRALQGITGPLFLGADTHPLSAPAERIAREVLSAAGVRVLTSVGGAYVPTPALSHAILNYNRGENEGVADGIIVTPSHNPPADGGFKYNEAHGGPADSETTEWVAARANELIEQVTAEGTEIARDTDSACEEFDFMTPYVDELGEVILVDAIRGSGLKIGAHPLGGAAHEYWAEIALRYDLDITVLGPGIDPTWAFMTLDWDGKIRMDPSSAHAMAVADQYRGEFDLVVANDADADRFGIMTSNGGLMPPNNVLAVSIDHLLRYRDQAWGQLTNAGVGKTLVSSALIDRVVASHDRQLVEMPVGFKWFVPGLSDGSVLFCGEESAGASFLRFDGTPWSTDKDGILMCLLAAEITAVTGRSLDEHYRELTVQHGAPSYARVDAAATAQQKTKLSSLAKHDITATELAGDPIVQVLTEAPGNGASIGGLKVETEHAWFAARPSGTEDVYKIYAESFRDDEHLGEVLSAAQQLVDRVLS